MACWLVGLVACEAGVPVPASFDAATDACAYCRMVGSDGRTAAQIVAPGAEPLFFDDIGCLRDYLRRGTAVPSNAVAFVIDHRTGTWLDARRALYTRQETLATPMGSHLMAHADQASRAADPAAAGGVLASVEMAIGGRAPAGGAE